MNYQRGQLIATGSFTRVYEPILDGKVIEDKVLLYTNCPFKEINCVHSNHYNILPYLQILKKVLLLHFHPLKI